MRQQRSLDKQPMDTRKKMCDGGGGCGTEEEGGDQPYLPQQTTAQLIRFKPQPSQHPFSSSLPFLKLSFCLNQMFFSSVRSPVFVSALSSRAFVVFLPGWLGWYRLAELSAVRTVRCCCPLCPTLPPGGAEELSQRHLRCPSRHSLKTARSLKQYINETTDAGKALME